MSNKWVRVSKKLPCGICGHIDWCCLGEHYWNCMRVTSNHPCANGGYLHPITGKPPPKPARQDPEPPAIDAAELMRQFSEETEYEWLVRFADHLGVSAAALLSLQCAWDSMDRAWAFPMMNGFGQPIGIRLRSENGKKWAIRGSRQGIFIPRSQLHATAYICEGPTDTAAGLTLGLFCIGRPSCTGCTSYTGTAIRRLGITRAVIVVDNDTPGIRGATFLADELQVPCCSLLLPAKDLREFLNLGGTTELIQSLTSSLVWHQPQSHHHKQNSYRNIPPADPCTYTKIACQSQK